MLPRALDVLFNSIEGKHYDRMNLKPRFCTDVTRLTDEEEDRENNYKATLLSSLDKEVCVIVIATFDHFPFMGLFSVVIF